MKDDETRTITKCKKCGTKMILMRGQALLDPDREPYENGKLEEISLELDLHVNLEYCEECGHIEWAEIDDKMLILDSRQPEIDELKKQNKGMALTIRQYEEVLNCYVEDKEK